MRCFSVASLPKNELPAAVTFGTAVAENIVVASKKVTKIAEKAANLTHRRPPRIRGGTPHLHRLLTHARRLVDNLLIPRSSATKLALKAEKLANVPEVRYELIDTLTQAIEETNKIAKQAGVSAEKGEGGMPAKARWYQLLGYLTQVLDGVCRNVELSEINERLAKVEGKVGIASSRTAQKG